MPQCLLSGWHAGGQRSISCQRARVAIGMPAPLPAAVLAPSGPGLAPTDPAVAAPHSIASLRGAPARSAIMNGCTVSRDEFVAAAARRQHPEPIVAGERAWQEHGAAAEQPARAVCDSFGVIVPADHCSSCPALLSPRLNLPSSCLQLGVASFFQILPATGIACLQGRWPTHR